MEISRLLILVIKAVILVTSVAGFPAGDIKSYQYQLMEMHKAYQGEEITQSLLEMLISMMNASTAVGVANDIVYGADDGNGAQATPGTDTCINGILSSNQVQDIQFQNSDLLFVIVNGQLVARERPLDLYIELFWKVSQIVGTTSEIDIWFSHAPCSECINYLEMMFGSFMVKPVLHIESLRYNGSNFDIVQDLGCLAKLTTRGYDLKPWDWDVFRATNGACDYYSNAKNNTEYMIQKNYTRTLLVFLEEDFMRSPLLEEDFMRSALVELC